MSVGRNETAGNRTSPDLRLQNHATSSQHIRAAFFSVLNKALRSQQWWLERGEGWREITGAGGTVLSLPRALKQEPTTHLHG